VQQPYATVVPKRPRKAGPAPVSLWPCTNVQPLVHPSQSPCQPVHYLKSLNKSSSKVVGGGARSGSLGGGDIDLAGSSFSGDSSNAASMEVGSTWWLLSFHLHQLFLAEFLPGIDITEPVGDIGGGLLSFSLSYVEFRLTLDRNLRMLPGLVDAGDVGERGGVVASIVVTAVTVSIS